MADNYVLNGPNGSSINVASFVIDPGPDFGEQDLIKAAYAENPAAEGGILAFETVNMRRMQFPLRIASVGAFGGAAGLQAWLRTLARPGATLDLQLDGVASSESIRFDVGAGRFEVDQSWDTKMWTQTDRFEGTLKLEVQPYGYWPTMILLASAASIGGPGVLSIPNASIIGDAPGIAEIFVAATSATWWGISQPKTESLFWSLGARPSFQGYWGAPSAIGFIQTPTLLGDALAIGSQVLRFFVPTVSALYVETRFKQIVNWVVPDSLEPAYRDRYRAFVYARLGPSQAADAWRLSLDAISATGGSYAMGSAAPVASLPVQVASSNKPGGGGASPAFHILDMGELSLPAVSSAPANVNIRLWVDPASTFVVPTSILDIGGLWLQPLGAGAGVLVGGLQQPSVLSGNFTGRFHTSATLNEVTIQGASSTVASPVPAARAGLYRGVLPRVGASTVQLDFNMAGLGVGIGVPTVPVIRSEPHFAQVSVRYRPRFMFAKGI